MAQRHIKNAQYAKPLRCSNQNYSEISSAHVIVAKIKYTRDILCWGVCGVKGTLFTAVENSNLYSSFENQYRNFSEI